MADQSAVVDVESKQPELHSRAHTLLQNGRLRYEGVCNRGFYAVRVMLFNPNGSVRLVTRKSGRCGKITLEEMVLDIGAHMIFTTD